MGTQNQKKIAKLIVENTKLDKPLNGGEMLAKVSYSKGLQKQPSRVIGSEGVQQELKILGFTEEKAMEVVADILENGEDTNRLKASDQIFKVHGSYAPEKRMNLNLNVKKEPNKKVKGLVDDFEDKLREQLLDETE